MAVAQCMNVIHATQSATTLITVSASQVTMTTMGTTLMEECVNQVRIYYVVSHHLVPYTNTLPTFFSLL